MTGQVVEEGFRTEPDVANVHGEYYGSYLRGYFQVPRDGTYKFYLSADDMGEFWMSRVPKPNAVYPSDMELLAQLTSWTPYRGYY
jgi:hypothetical protein